MQASEGAAQDSSKSKRESYGGSERQYTIVGGHYVEIQGASASEVARFTERYSHADQWSRYH